MKSAKKFFQTYKTWIYAAIAVVVGLFIYFSPRAEEFKNLSIVLVVLFLGIIIYFFIQIQSLKKRVMQNFSGHFVTNEPTSISPRETHWRKISDMISSEDSNLWRLAIIDADTMLEELVSDMGYQGVSFGDKLKQISRQQAPWIDAAWEAHRLRNVLAHEGNRYPLNHREAYRAFKIYENILYDKGYFS